jgi:glycosyltransferase involved in cell wall biosynthesis
MSTINISVVVEWENAILADCERPRRMLAELGRQIANADLRCEVLFVHNPANVDRDMIVRAIADGFGDASVSFPWRIEAATNQHYYGLKNVGARLATGDIVVMIDSDVVPEPGWLAALVAPFMQSPDVMVVGGNTYLDRSSLAGKALALGWIFPLRCEDGALSQSGYFAANNVAFRRTFLLANPFPDMPAGATRGACARIAEDLRARGVTIWQAGAAHMNHPAPKSLHRVVVRGLAEGRDWAFNGNASLRAWFGYVAAIPRLVDRVIRIIRESGARVDLAQSQVGPAVLLHAIYYVTRAVGAFVAILMPAYARRAWRI